MLGVPVNRPFFKQRNRMSTISSSIQLLPEVEEFLSNGPIKAVVGGKEVSSSGNEIHATIDPGSGETLAEFVALQDSDIDEAVIVAAKAFRQTGWGKMPASERSALLQKLADLMDEKKEVLAQLESIDCGKVHSQALGDIEGCISTFRNFADAAISIELSTSLNVKGHEARVVRHPWGVCGFIVPWNFPMILLGWGLAPALAAGNTVVLKPAEDTPLSALYFGRLAKQAGIPDGVINIVPGLGEVAGAALANHPELKRMSFTGSPEVGQLVAESCGKNLTPVKLELGGKGAAVVFDDVNIEETAQKLVDAITFHAGQVCCDATRWLIHKNIYSQFADECVARLQKIRIGHELDSKTQMGPVVNKVQLDRILGFLKRGSSDGADTLLEGGAAEVEGRNGFYVKPALLAGGLDNVAACQEIFGPVAFLSSFDNEEQAIEMANNTDYGLANSVWSADLTRCNRVAEAMVAGNSWINAHNVFAYGVPYGGVNKSGMGGGVNSIETLMDYYRTQSVVRPLDSLSH
jgi:aldehyde dehydrogenase (NAD+)